MTKEQAYSIYKSCIKHGEEKDLKDMKDIHFVTVTNGCFDVSHRCFQEFVFAGSHLECIEYVINHA